MTPTLREGPFPDTVEDSLRDRGPDATTIRPHLIVVLEGDRPLAGGARFSLAGVQEIDIGRGDTRTATVETHGGAKRLTLLLPSASLSRLHARIRRGPTGWTIEDAGSRNGTYVNGQRIERGTIGQADLLEVGHAFVMLRDLEQRLDAPLGDLEAAELEQEPAAFRTLLPALSASLEDLRRVALSPVGVLHTGDTGTGKEVLARAIHDLSKRPGPFVAVNCNTLTEGLAESQLFGHVKGAFSGAVGDSVGFVRSADRGTLLLDEVGDLGATAQGALLRVLQEREVVPVGRANAQKVDVRFIATTPRALDPGLGRDRFRADLFARLTGFVYEMTPLRERREDLGLLVAALLRRGSVTVADRPRIGPDLGLGLLCHAWPLNIRELEQLLTRTWLLAKDGLMSGEPSFVSVADMDSATASPTPAGRPPRALTPEEQEMQKRLDDALAAAHGNVTEAARALGTGRVQFHRLMKRLGVDASKYRS